MMPDEEDVCLCERCLRELTPGRGSFYVVRIEGQVDPTPPRFTREDLERDLGVEISRLIERTRDLTEREAMEQVHRRVVLTLCVECFKVWIEDPVGTNPS